jgi:hypothetical protein
VITLSGFHCNIFDLISDKQKNKKKKIRKKYEPLHLLDGRAFLLEQHRELGQVLSEVVWEFQAAKSSTEVFGNLK